MVWAAQGRFFVAPRDAVDDPFDGWILYCFQETPLKRPQIFNHPSPPPSVHGRGGALLRDEEELAGAINAYSSENRCHAASNSD